MTQMKLNMTTLVAPRSIIVLAALAAILLAGCAGPVLIAPVYTTTASELATPTPSAYRELLASDIRGIDPETIAGYLAGEGLGMALPAELNGYPGPRHVLDLRAELELTSEQTERIQSLFDEMQPRAIELGEAYLAAEAKLESDFRNGTIDEDGLFTQLQQIADIQTNLRFVHLRTHLSALEILSQHQVREYDTLRGYVEMPAGHEHQEHN